MTQQKDHIGDVNKMVTAVEWYVKEIQNRLKNIGEVNYVKLAKQAKKMEKEQIMKAVNVGFKEGCKFPDITIDSAEQYYNETYSDGKKD